jgi:hypothetical protein
MPYFRRILRVNFHNLLILSLKNNQFEDWYLFYNFILRFLHLANEINILLQGRNSLKTIKVFYIGLYYM